MTRGDAALVVALGGNALSPPSATGSAEEMRAALASTAAVLADLVVAGERLVVTHGNGPQVGRILLQQEYAAEHVPPMPMDVCGAESQGQIGYLLAAALDAALLDRGQSTRAVCVVTQVVVDGRHRAFRRPTKPVGPSYPRPQARAIAEATGHVFRITPDRSWRRVVPSPPPLAVVELDAIRALLDAGFVVVAGGGGGVPVVDVGDGFRGVEAVVDKDLTASLLARSLDARLLVILTGIAQVQLDYGTPEARAVDVLTTAEATALLKARAFDEGSMGPKVRAAVEFVTAGGPCAVIAALSDAAAAVAGRAGTAIVAKGDHA